MTLYKRTLAGLESPALVCWALDDALIAMVRQSGQTVHTPRSEQALSTLLASVPCAIVLCALPKVSTRLHSIRSVIENARATGTHVGVVAIALPGHTAFATVLDWAHTGLTSLLLANPMPDRRDLAAALFESQILLTGAFIWETLLGKLPCQLSDAAVTIVRRALNLAHQPVTLPVLAQACQMHERSLRKYCTRHHLPEPQRIISWARLARAAALIDGGTPPLAVSTRLGFPSSEALRKLASRMLHHPMRQLIAGTALNQVCERFGAELTSDRYGQCPAPLQLVR